MTCPTCHQPQDAQSFDGAFACLTMLDLRRRALCRDLRRAYQESHASGLVAGHCPDRGALHQVCLERAALEPWDQLAKLRALLSTPEVEDFDKALPLEAAHQVDRWGSEHDAGKQPEDWFWLLGWLAGKAVHAVRAGDTQKAKHHTITAAAMLRNWHAQLRTGASVMRPGILSPQEGAQH